MPSPWTRLRAAVDPLARRLNAYTAYRLHGNEYVGTTHDLSLADARHYLRQNAYRPQYLSAAKRHPMTGALHDLSYRHVPDAHPDAWAVDRYAPGDCQYHVHAFRRGAKIDWYSHYEVRPFADPWTHYRPTYGTTYLMGESDLQL